MQILVAFYWYAWYRAHVDKEILNNLKTIETDLQRRLNQIEEEERTLKQDLQSIKRMLARYKGQIDIDFTGYNLKTSPGSFEIEEGVAKLTITKTLKEQILEVLRDISPRPLRAGQIRREVTRRGYVSVAKSFEGAMFAMLSNLRKKNIIEKVGSGLYRIAN